MLTVPSEWFKLELKDWQEVKLITSWSQAFLVQMQRDSLMHDPQQLCSLVARAVDWESKVAEFMIQLTKCWKKVFCCHFQRACWWQGASVTFARSTLLASGLEWYNVSGTTDSTQQMSLNEYAIPKIKMLRNLSRLKARFRLLRNKLSTAQQSEPRFKTA